MQLGVGAAAVRSMVDDIESMSFMKKCRELPEKEFLNTLCSDELQSEGCGCCVHEGGEEGSWCAGQGEMAEK